MGDSRMWLLMYGDFFYFANWNMKILQQYTLSNNEVLGSLSSHFLNAIAQLPLFGVYSVVVLMFPCT